MAIQQTRRALEPGSAQQMEVRSTEDRSIEQSQRHYRNGGRHARVKDAGAERLAKGLGWFSRGLGLAEVIAPKSLARLIGSEGNHTLFIRLMGLREITAGVGILTNRKPTGWMWARVAGDGLAFSFLGLAYMSGDSGTGGGCLST